MVSQLRWWKWYAVWAIVSGALLVPAVSFGQDKKSYKLETLVNRARTNSDLIQEFEAKRNEAEWKRYRANWASAPKIQSLTTVAPVPANADPDRVNENFDEIADLNIGPFVSTNLDLIVPVFTFGRISKLQELAQVGVDVSKLKKREAQLNAIFQTKRAYYSLRLSETFDEMLQEGDERIGDELQEMQDARDFGEADFSTEDFRELQIFSAEVDSRIVDNKKLETVATSGLQYLAEVDAETFRVHPFDRQAAPPELATYRRYLAAAKRHRPDLKQLEHAVEARQLQVGIENSKWFPEIFATAGLSVGWSTEETALQPVCTRPSRDAECEDVTNFEETGEGLFARPDSDPLSRFSLRVGLGMRWNLDPLGQRGKVQAQQAKLRALEAQRDRAQGGVAVELRKKFQDAADSLEKIEINDRRLEAARRWRDQLGLSIETAGAEADDAIKPLKAYYQAKAKYFEARYQYLIDRAALAQAVGVDYLSEVDGEANSIDLPEPMTPGESIDEQTN